MLLTVWSMDQQCQYQLEIFRQAYSRPTVNKIPPGTHMHINLEKYWLQVCCGCWKWCITPKLPLPHLGLKLLLPWLLGVLVVDCMQLGVPALVRPWPLRFMGSSSWPSELTPASFIFTPQVLILRALSCMKVSPSGSAFWESLPATENKCQISALACELCV